MDKVMLLVGVGGLAWSINRMNVPQTKASVGIAIGSLILLNISISSILNEHKQKESKFLIQ